MLESWQPPFFQYFPVNVQYTCAVLIKVSNYHYTLWAVPESRERCLKSVEICQQLPRIQALIT